MSVLYGDTLSPGLAKGKVTRKIEDLSPDLLETQALDHHALPSSVLVTNTNWAKSDSWHPPDKKSPPKHADWPI